MDWDRARLSARIYGVRAKAKLRLLVQIAGLLALLLGAYNLLVVPMGYEAVAPYRVLGTVFNEQQKTAFHIGDVVLMAAGAAIAWWA